LNPKLLRKIHIPSIPSKFSTPFFQAILYLYSMTHTPVCIVGGGPGGAAAALKLSYLNIPCVLIDKATFPRDKVCGDAISGKAPLMMKRLDPDMLARFEAMTDQQLDVWGITFVAPNRIALDIPFKVGFDKDTDPTPGYVCRRTHFDNFLIQEVKRRPSIQFFSGTEVSDIQRTSNGYKITDKSGNLTFETPMLIVANGAQSRFSRLQAGLDKDLTHHAGAVRAYFKNVADLHADNFIELHFLKEINPGYFWIFPLPNGAANVGLGMRSDYIKKNKVNLRKVMQEIIDTHPDFAPRFKEATMEGPVVGYGLPLGSKKRPLSGDHYMLVGDAGHLIDPLTGEGIGNAFYSGIYAAEQAAACLQANNFSADFLQEYDTRIARVLYSEMKLSYLLQRALRYPRLTNLLATFILRNRRLIELISQMYNDMELRKQLVNPLFWGKVISGRY
jgi:geranylgeranyl reductase family protein